jgi:CDP-6-deoxy-D-xylo-4-hexulose-3-dehydrase
MSRPKIFYSPNTFQSFGAPEIDAVQSFLTSHPFNSPDPIVAFENRISSLCGMSHGIFVNSGSSANLLACLALGLGPNSEVITPACTFPTSVSPMVFLGSNVIFSDVAEGRYVPSVSQVLSLVTPKTTAILIPDIVGDIFDFQGLRGELEKAGRGDVKLIEDACDTVTRSVADFATLSLYASHIISGGGCGGVLMTNDGALAERARELRESDAWDLRAPAYCAVFALKNMEQLETFSEARRKNFLRYCENLKSSSFYEVPKVNEGVWLSMPLICKSHRFEIVEELEKRQIQTRLCLAGTILRQPFYAARYPETDPEAFPNTEKVFERGLLIGLHQGVADEDVDFVCAQLEEIAASVQAPADA